MPVKKLLSVAQVSARLQCARSTVRKLVAKGELRASRIPQRTIRISESDLQTYLDGRANRAAAVDSWTTTKGGLTMTPAQLTAALAERVMEWKVCPDRFVMSGRSWIPKWRFRPLESLDDAFLLLDRAGCSYVLSLGADGIFTVVAQIGGRIGKATGEPKARTVTLAMSPGLGFGEEWALAAMGRHPPSPGPHVTPSWGGPLHESDYAAFDACWILGEIVGALPCFAGWMLSKVARSLAKKENAIVLASSFRTFGPEIRTHSTIVCGATILNRTTGKDGKTKPKESIYGSAE